MKKLKQENVISVTIKYKNDVKYKRSNDEWAMRYNS